MKSLIQILAVFSLLINFSCGSSSSTGSTYQDPHSKMHSKMHNEYYQEEAQKALGKQVNNVIGSYSGIAPCIDCEGIDISLELLPDLTYNSTVTYKGKPNPPLTKSGTYQFNGNGHVQLTPPSGNVAFLMKFSDGLLIVDKDGKEIKSSEGKSYVLGFAEKKK